MELFRGEHSHGLVQQEVKKGGGGAISRGLSACEI